MILLVLGLFLNLTPAQAIIGGVPVSAEDEIAKSTVLLYGYADQGSFICSGTILDSSHILTAAHCVADIKDMFILFTNNAGTPALVESILLGRTYARKASRMNHNIDYPNTGLGSRYPHNDIGIVKFSGGIPAGFKPVMILNPALMGNYIKRDQQVILAGFGQRSGEGVETGVLYKNAVTVKSAYSKTVVVGEGGSSACHGDSGGPAFVSINGKLYQWGVLSRGEPGCTSSAIYTPLTSNFYGKMANPDL